MKFYQMLFFSLLLLASCSSANPTENTVDAQMMIGDWQCSLAADDFKGTDIFRLGSDSCMIDTQLRDYTIRDSGFECAMTVRFGICGRWSLCRDSLVLCYDTGTMTFVSDAASCSIRPLVDGADLDQLQEIKEEMRHALSEHIKEAVFRQYDMLAGKDVFVGKIEKLSHDTMYIENNSIGLLLTKVQKHL